MPERPCSTRAAAVPAVLLTAGLLTGCGAGTTAPQASTAPAPAPATASAGVTAAATLGGPGTACALPVSFALAADWEPEAIEDAENPEFAALTRRGPAFARCEVDAKPAGHLGFLRIWTAGGTGPARTALEGFVKAERKTSRVTYRETVAGALPATEVTYTAHDEALGEVKEERAFAVATRRGTVIVHLGGLDTDEHRAMLPAYELARTTVKAL
ncbi:MULTISPECIES: lipoprotein [unclassified Streptomyces]|uniref:lipoprotein n=1 Tax=unclassified Streptomyces TaxID=2593676 RepID=UPI00368216C4